jgi:phosphate-selective porin OprO/OprP
MPRARGLAVMLMAALAPLHATAQPASSENAFSYEFHGTFQYDMASFMQEPRAAGLPIGANLSDGGVWRRLWARVVGNLSHDWLYLFELQGNTSGTIPVSVRQAYVEYDGWAPVSLRIGAHVGSTGMEGSTPAASAILMERSSVSTLQRSMGGGPITGATLIYTGRDFYASLALGAGVLADTPLDWDRHSTIAARAADIVYRDADTVIAVAGSSTAILRIADNPPGATVRRLQLNGNPELGVNTTALVSSGALDAESAWSWALENAGTWRSFFAQAGYARFGVNRRQTLSDIGRNYQGFYVGASWILTGERRRWSPGNGAFIGPSPSQPVDKGGLGAWELAVRYSDLDFNDHPGQVGSAVPLGGSRGGEQRILGLGLNWSPTEMFRFMFQFQNVQIDRIGTLGTTPNAEIGQTYQSIALRSQLTF